MDTAAGTTSGLSDQQVMSSQSTTAQQPRPAEQLEGETSGPNYRELRPPGLGQAAPRLPNGVPPRAVEGASPTAEMESLPYSPTRVDEMRAQGGRNAATRSPSQPALLQEVWPTQPDALVESRGVPPAPLMWMSRLADFLRTQVQGSSGSVETRTTLTRHQVMGGTANNGGVVLQHEQVRHTTSQPTSQAPSPMVRGSQPAEQSRDPPLFGSAARRIMESWPQRAPLLYGQPGQGAGTDADSSGSIPREMVQEEVKRQVTEALDSQRQAMQQLMDENHRLRSEIAARPLRVEHQEASPLIPVQGEADGPLTGHEVPGGNPRNVMEYLGAIQTVLLQVMEYLGAIHRALLQVMEYLGAIRITSWSDGRSTSYAEQNVMSVQRDGAFTDDERRGGGGLRSYLPGTSGLRSSSFDRKSSPLGRLLRSSSPSNGLRGTRGPGLRAGSGIRDAREGAVLDGVGYGYPGAERAYRQPYYQETKTFGDYDVGPPPGLPQQARAPEPEQRLPAAVNENVQQPQPESKKEPTAVDVLLTGMAQLQQLLLKKNDGLDVDAKGTPELPKLGEYNPETGAIEFQDFLYLVEQQVGSLASGAGEWWQKTLQVAQAAYMEYQALSPVKRLGVRAQLSEELQDDRFKRLEKKVAAMLLCALPKGVKDDLIAYRVQGVHQILYRLMVIFQPGGAQDRAQILRQLDVSESAAGAPEAVVAIRKWYRLLQRASDLGVTLPDESLQVKSLSAIVRKTSEQNSDFRFRLALARTELQIDTRPNQANVLKYMQHLLAELEQLGASGRKPPAVVTTPTTTATPSSSATTPAVTLKGVQDAQPKPGAKPKATPTTGVKKPCQWFGTDNGCRNGKNCNFLHSWSGLSRAERCLLCGSKKHRAKECTNGKSDSSPERGGAAQLARAQAPRTPSTTTSQAPVEVVTAVSDAGAHREVASSSSTTTSNKIDPAQMTEILNETNKMLKAFTASQASHGASSPVDPLAAIQQQLDEVRRLKAIVVREPGLGGPSFQSALSWYEQRLSSSTLSSFGSASTGEALLDSGASHPFRPASTDEELRDARRVVVSLATGEERAILQTKEGTLLSEGSNEPPLVPMGQLVTLLGCTVRWSPTRLSVVHPVHGKLSVKLRGACPVIPVGQALALIAEMEQARMEEFERTVDALSVQMKMLREQGRDEWPWRRHLQALREDGDRTSMAGFVHRCPTFAALPPEVLLGLPEAVPRGAKDGWKLLKGLPWSRAKRKTLYQSDSWVVHLFSGDDRPREAKEQSLMRRSFWGGALEGGDVLVDVDITASKSMDLRQQGAVFRLLSWAALNGKIKAIIGGPPRHSFPRPGQSIAAAGQPLKETQLIARMLALWYMAEEGRSFAWRHGLLKSPPVKPHVGFMMEHPRAVDSDDPRHSIFQTLMWRTFADDELMGEVPCLINGRPSVLAGNLDLWHLRDESMGALEAQHPAGSIWPLELVVHIAGAVCSWKGLRNREGLLASLVRVAPPEDFEHVARLAKFNVGEWKLHLQNDHLPYRRDCRVCVEKASGRPHRRISHPSAYSLAIDLAGPFRNVGAGGYKYLMVGCYRFPKLIGGIKAEEEAEKLPTTAPEDGDDWLFEELELPADAVHEEVAEELPPLPEVDDEEAERADKEIEALKELAKPLEFSSVYLARPMKSRKKKDALRAVQELYVQLRSSGFPLSKLHMDRARELQTDALDAWAAARDIEVTRTQGSDPAGNGTAERAVGAVKARIRVLLGQAKELSGTSDEQIRTWWPFAAETVVAQHQALAFGRKLPTVARFGSKVFTKRKGYGVGGRFDLQPRWLEATYLGPARSVPGGHLVFTDEGNLWYTTSIRQFDHPPADVEAGEAEGEVHVPPARRIRRKSSIVELAGGVGLMPGLRGDPEGEEPAAPGLRAITRLASTLNSSSSDELVSENESLAVVEVVSESALSQRTKVGPRGDLAAEYLREGRFSMNDCLEVLENEVFRKTRKQRSSAWKDHPPPPVHSTLGAYQRGPWKGVTTATRRHESLTAYLVAMFRHHCDQEVLFTSMTVAKDLCTDAHRDRFNSWSSTNYVITVGAFDGGGIWQEGHCEGVPVVSVQVNEKEAVKGYVLPVRNKVVQVNPKKLHKTMPWQGGPKWTVIAHTIGQHEKMPSECRDELQSLGFPLPPPAELKMMQCSEAEEENGEIEGFVNGPSWFPPPDDPEEEMWTRMWTRRLLDEEEVLTSTVPKELHPDFQAVAEVNGELADSLTAREEEHYKDRYDAAQWLVLCKLAEGEDEVRGVESLLEALPGPLKVVYTVALDEVKQFVDRWSGAIVKEADALIQAKALVPLSIEQQKALEASGKLVILPAKGVFTVKPPDEEVLVGPDGRELPHGSPEFYKRKARLVICGNFQTKQAKEDSYAGGCQTDSLRVMLVHCAGKRWLIACTDIRNAFILAPIKDEDDDEEEVYALYPPKVFQLARVQYALRLWRVDRALYGFRRSPRLWGKFRDKRLRGASIPFEGGRLYLRQHRADENVWSVAKVQPDSSEVTVGYVNIYVDDILYMGEEAAICAVHSWLTQEWKASPLTWASTSSTIRFLGLEIGRTELGGVRVHQRGYIEELLRHHDLWKEKGHTTPCPQEWLLGETEFFEKQHTSEQLRRAQALTGELLWLSGKSRPDLLHTVATMSALCLKDAELVEKIGLRALGYLKNTIDVELYYKPESTQHVIVGYSDASFAPQGSRSFGCSVACYLNQPISWRCGRQSLIALSVAEAELIEAINAVQMMQGLAAFTGELHDEPPRMQLRVDNSAAVGLSNESAGTWKTRHLRVRAYHLREAVRLKQLSIVHVAGVDQLGDLGTKAFHRPRLQQLLHLWGLRRGEEENEVTPSTLNSMRTGLNGSIAILARFVVVLGWLIQGSRAASSTSSGIEVSMPWDLYGLAVLCIIAAIAVWEAIKWFFEWISLGRKGSVEEARGARRLRRLQQVVQEEVSRYDLHDQGDAGPSTPLSSSARPTMRPSPTRPVNPTRRSVEVQTEPVIANYMPFRGPFVMSEYGDRVHFDPTCHGLRNARTRTRQVTLCQYCERQQGLFQHRG
ncbi:Copia protein [Symbiodinium microadriaticum]|uniref:Copia protein n=1 Tax=Symbiodinium microadriaticum TaxID=2951 RepID=A0A1Q9ER75_SYMMI|nr:Copia protein [Symbiodinium microadriaticum]